MRSLVFLAAMGIAASAALAGPGWIADARTGCKVWAFDPKPEETILWPGSCENGLVEGKGVMVLHRKGKPYGIYVGETHKGRFHGQGDLTLPDGVQYTGGWRDGLPDGQGTHKYASGSRYIGEWLEGLYNGTGTFAWANGNRYEGGWKAGKASGTGTYTSKEIPVTGTWLGGCLQVQRGGTRPRIGVGTPSSDCR